MAPPRERTIGYSYTTSVIKLGHAHHKDVHKRSIGVSKKWKGCLGPIVEQLNDRKSFGSVSLSNKVLRGVVQILHESRFWPFQTTALPVGNLRGSGIIIRKPSPTC